MNTPPDSLLKYDTPVLVSKNTERKSPKSRPLKASPQQMSINAPVPPPPKSKSPSTDASQQQTEEILNAILPPREWMEDNQLWVQQVSTAPCTRSDVIQLKEQLHKKLEQYQAKETGICSVRRDLYSQCFDELIRQITINCAERGLLVLQVRDEIRMTIAAYQTLYESSIAFGMRKALQGEHGKLDMENKELGDEIRLVTDILPNVFLCVQQKKEMYNNLRTLELESEKRDLERLVNEQKAKCEAIERREGERREIEEKKHAEEVQFLKKANQQLKAQLESIITLKNKP